MTPLLIVEDEDVVAGTMERWLSGLGYEVTRVPSAEDAVKVLKDAHPWVAIVDIGLPGHDGLWLTDQIRRDFPHTAVVLATGRDFLPPATTLRTGIVSYLVKPFKRDQLRIAVSDAVRWYEESTVGQDAGPALERAARECRQALADKMRRLNINTQTEEALAALFPDPADMASIERVVAMTEAIGKRFKLSKEDRETIDLAARIHRICRLAIPDAILKKPDTLTGFEMNIARRAPSEVFKLLLDYPSLSAAGHILRSLREREDGLGIPDRLVGDAIPLGSRILAVSEAIEAIMHDQPHKPARTEPETERELKQCSGTQFDAKVVAAAIGVLASGSTAAVTH